MRHRRRRRRVVVAVLAGALGAAAAAVGVARVRAEPPPPQVSIGAAAAVQVPPGTQAATVVPAAGSFALELSGAHLLPGTPRQMAAHDAATPRPMASLAKALTALVVLQLRPLAAGEEGPLYRIGSADVSDYRAALAAGGSTVFVSPGETFTERQLLLALMLPSGNNIAETLARWAAGSRAAFLARANQEAVTLGMTATHLADPSGFDPATVASASDLARLGEAVLAQPALAAIVATRRASLPDGTEVANLDTALFDVPGWLGIKTGNSDAAGGCLLFAARRPPPGDADPADAVTVVGAVLGQHSLLPHAGGADDRAAALFAATTAVASAFAQLVAVRPAQLHPGLSGAVTTPWGASSRVALGAPVAPHAWVARGGTALTLHESAATVVAPLPAGADVGRLEALAGTTVVATWPVETLQGVPAPDWVWRLEHG